MEIKDFIKQLKSVEPDPSFAASSKRAILALLPAEPALRGVPRFRATILKIIETGAAVALTGFFILLITGAFSDTGLVPQYGALNPNALQAEAQAIDIQIQLANLNYAEALPQANESTLQIATNTPAATAALRAATGAAVSTGAAASSSAGAQTTTVTIDQALQGLAQ